MCGKHNIPEYSRVARAVVALVNHKKEGICILLPSMWLVHPHTKGSVCMHKVCDIHMRKMS